MNKEFQLGFRSIKTIVAVTITLLVSALLGRGTGFYGTNAAVVCIQPTQKQSLGSGLVRIVGTMIGAFFGYLLLTHAKSFPLYFQWAYLVMIPLYLVVVIGFCAFIRQYGAIAMSSIMFLSIATNFNFDIPNTFQFVLNRVVDTSIGIVIAMLVNHFLFPTNNERDKQTTTQVIVPLNQQETAEMELGENNLKK